MTDIVTLLSGPELPPASGGKPKQLVILLHGLGSDGDDLIGLAPEFAEILPDAQFLSPNAPFRCDMSPFGYQWFSLLSYDPQAMQKGAEHAAPILNHFIDASLERFKMKDSQLALVGFSQGTMMSLYVGLRRAQACAGILGYSGALLDSPLKESVVKSRPEICLVHGMADPVVPFMALDNAVRNLEAADVPVESHPLSMLAHGIDQRCIEIGRSFLKRVFKK